MATLIHGIAASENIDSSGECVSIAGLDISSLDKDGVFTYEHEQAKVPGKDGKQVEMQVKIPSQVVGKILKARKIFSEKDCEDQHQLYFWNKVNTPYLYIMGELFDDYTEAAKDVAGKFRYDADKKGQNTRTVMNFSVEGNVLPDAKKGMNITRSIAKKVTLTGFPCNKAAIAEMISQPPREAGRDDISSIFKTEPPCEIEIFKFETNYAELLSKKEEVMSKGKPTWSNASVSGDKSAVHFSHPEHGIVSVHKQKTGEFHVKHQGKLAGHGGAKGNFPSAGEAGKHAKSYMSAISQKKTLAPKMHNRPSPEMPKMGKATDAGSALAAPSQLTQGSALAKDDKSTFNQKGVHMPPLSDKKGGTSVMGTHVRNPSSTGSGSKEMARRHAASNLKQLKAMPKPDLGKSELLLRAEQEYQSWGKKEQFEQFMKNKMPHLNKAEIKAIGQTLALQKSIKMEKALSRINPAYEEETTQHSSLAKKNSDK